MDENELKELLEQLEIKLAGKNSEQASKLIAEQKAELDKKLEQKLSEMMTAKDENFAELKGEFEKEKTINTELKSRLDVLETKVAESRSAFQDGDQLKDFGGELKSKLKEGFDEIKNVSKGRNAKLTMKDVEIKAVGTMTSANNLTGGVVNTYQGGIARVPSQMVNMADLVPSVQSSTGSYVIYRETGSEGSISSQATAGDPKTQIDYDITEVVFNATYISGYARFAKQMAQDLPFLTSFLPEALRRDYFKAENTIFYTALKAAATASTATGLDPIEKLITDIGELENADYMVNGVVLNPIDWATIAITKPSDYSLPQVVAYVNGQLVINGIPVYKASFIDEDEYMVGDWSMAKKIITDGLAVEFFEQDQDNVVRNLITARVESRTVLGIDRPDAFIKGTFTDPT